ncbi:MAG: helix-turn-helix domain-containing protein, partial [Ktedonobacteraceae bacterium]
QANTGAPAAITSLSGTPTERDDEHSLTYREGKVYDYLKAHLGEVCDKTEIMQAVWGEDNMPSHSALQKIIERIREKIEDDPDSPYKLIAVRGRGYMLRKAL